MRSIRGRVRNHAFPVALFAIGIVAIAVRLLYGHAAYVSRGLGDDWWYHWMANAIAAGRGFNNPFDTFVNGHVVRGFAGAPIPTAFHPPLFPVVLAAGSKLGLTTYEAHRAIGCALGGGTAIVVGLCGRRLGGSAVGIASASVAAFFPPLVANDSTLFSESLYGLLVAVVVLAALRLRAAPSIGRAALLGAGIGAAALTRSEAILLVPLLVPFVVQRSWRTGLVAAGVAVLTVVPWCIRNTLEFDRPVTIATGDGYVLAGANTPAAYHGNLLGGWDVHGLQGPAPAAARAASQYPNEAVGSDAGRSKAFDFAREHIGRLPVVLAARVLRTWNQFPFPPSKQVDHFSFFSGSTRWAQWLLLFSTWLACALSVIGALVLRRRGQPLAPLLAPIVLVTVVSASFNGDPRYRDAADISLVLLGTFGAFALWQRLSTSRRDTGSATQASPPFAATPT